MNLSFDPNYKSWRYKFETEAIYTRKDLSEALENQRKRLIVNRIIQMPSGRWDNTNRAMQILAIHETPEGLMVCVR